MTAADLDRLMAELEQALAEGRVDRLGALTDGLEAALPLASGLEREGLVALRKRADRNLRRIEAALSGVRSARRRIAEIIGAERPTTYDVGGAKHRLTDSRNGHRV